MLEKSLMEGLPVLLHFPQSSPNEWICSEEVMRHLCLRKRMISWNRDKLSWASDGSPPTPAQILSHWPWRQWLPFSWRVTWKSDCSHFQEAQTSLLSLQGRLAGARRAASLSIFCNQNHWIRGFKMAPMANGSHVSFNWNLSLRKLERWAYYIIHSLSQFLSQIEHFISHATWHIPYIRYYTDSRWRALLQVRAVLAM